MARTIIGLGIAVVFRGFAAHAEMPDAIQAPGQTPVAQLHAEGAQIYECKADPAGGLVWRFREPIATLIVDGETVGRHYAGPTWELADGGSVVGKVAASAPGATAADIAWLRLDIVARHGAGRLASVTTVQRINTKGGATSGACGSAGAFTSASYSADYVFLRKD